MKPIYILFIAFGFTACELVVPIELPDQEPKLVLNGFLQADSAVHVFLTRSFGMYEEFEPNEIQGASITLTNGQAQTFPFVENPLVPARYDINNFALQSGETYTITANAPDLPTVTGTTTVPSRIEFDTIHLDKGARIDRDSVPYDVWTLALSDPPGQDDYYILRVRWKSNIQNYWICFETLDPVLADLDVLNNGNDVAYLCEGYFNDAIFNGSTYRLQIFTESNYSQQPGASMVFDLLHVDAATFSYVQSSDLQYQTDGNPFAEPVIVFNNIDNGFGIIGSYTVSSYEVQF